MNESEYFSDVETVEESISEDSSWSDSSPVTEISDTGSDGVYTAPEVSETTETYSTAVSSVDNLEVIANNTSGILLMVTALFFAVVIAFIAKIFGGYFSM